MSLRMRILLFLFLFGLMPLLLAVVINLPLVLERIDLFYRHAFLQNLRADFSDLDQHLASRDASVRLLAKLPEPGALIGSSQEKAEIDLARARYSQWINRILGEERDITEILFLDEAGVERFWLERDSLSGEWRPTTRRPRGVPLDQAALILSGRLNNVVLSPLQIDLDAEDPTSRRSGLWRSHWMSQAWCGATPRPCGCTTTEGTSGCRISRPAPAARSRTSPASRKTSGRTGWCCGRTPAVARSGCRCSAPSMGAPYGSAVRSMMDRCRCSAPRS
jgi:hypothetical protein